MSIEDRGALSVREAAEYLSLGRTTVFQLVRSKQIDSVKVGRRRLIKIRSLKEFLGEGE